MTQNSTHRYERTVVLGVERIEAPVVVTSEELDERLGEVYRRPRMRAGLLAGPEPSAQARHSASFALEERSVSE